MNVIDFRKTHDLLFESLSKNEQLKNNTIRDLINTHTDTYAKNGNIVVSDVVTLLKIQNFDNNGHLVYLDALAAVIGNEQYPEITDKVKKIVDHMKGSKDIPNDLLPGVHFALDKIGSYKGNDLRLYNSYLKKLLNSKEDKIFVGGALQAVNFFENTYKAPLISRSSNMSERLGIPQKFVSFLHKHETFFNTLSESDRQEFKPFKNKLNNFIEKLSRSGGNIESISVCDAITSLLYQGRNDPEYSKYLRLVDNILENEQYPEVAENKLQIISHMRNSLNIPEEAKEGVQFALEKIEMYKGNELNKYISVMMTDLNEMKSEKTHGFISGASQALKFFNKQYKHNTKKKTVSLENTFQ